MKLRCPECGYWVSYVLPSEGYAGRLTVTTRCPECSALLTVEVTIMATSRRQAAGPSETK